MIIDTNFIKARKTAEGCAVSLWNRTYTTGGEGAVFSSITSAGHELLARPATVNVFSGGAPCVFGKAQTYIMADGKEDEKTILSAFESETVVVNISHRIEEDGCDDITLTVMPRGRSVAQVFGLAPVRTDAFDVNRVYLDIPLRKDAVRYYHTYPFGGRIGYTQAIDNNILNFAGTVPSGGFHCAFKEQVYLGGEECGLGLFFTDNRMWVNTDETKAIEILEEEDCYVMRINLLDAVPPMWQDKGPDNQYAMDLMPWRVKLGMVVTPVRPYPKRNFYSRSAKIDAYIKIFCDYDEFLSGKKNADGSAVEGEITETRYDRLKRLGVETLLIHEKWNDIQNSPFLTEDTVRRAKTIVSELHQRKIKVIPYFGYELSTLSPIWAQDGDEMVRISGNINSGYWYRFPYQRDMNVCMRSRWADILYDGIVKLYDELGFDGLYFDTIMEPRPCANERHGCGWRDKNGELHATYSTWEIRRFLKKMYAFVKSRGGTMVLHAYGAFNLAGLSFCDYMVEGEPFQTKLLHGELKEMPEDLLRAQFTGYDTGIPVKTIIYINEPVWTYKNALSTAILHGSIPNPNDISRPLEMIVPVWNALDRFPLEEAEWKPYFSPTDSIACSDPHVKISVWETAEKILAVCATTAASFEGKVRIQSKFPKLVDSFTGKVLTENGEFTAEFKGFDFMLIEGEK